MWKHLSHRFANRQLEVWCDWVFAHKKGTKTINRKLLLIGSAVICVAWGIETTLGQAGSDSGQKHIPTLINFDDTETGKLPAGWKVEATRSTGKSAEWSVQMDSSAPSRDRALALTNTHDARGRTFNLCWTDQIAFKDGTIEVKVKARKGREDQGGGPIWRVIDHNNYYIARWNPLEDNLRLYYVKDGRRNMLESTRVSLSPQQWQTIKIRHVGTHIECYLNGKMLLEADDNTFLQSGGIGVWTKADAATSFDDLSVKTP